MRIRTAASFALFLLTACGGGTSSEASPDASAVDGRTVTDGGPTIDSGPSDGDAANACPTTSNVPSRQTVQLVVTNHATADRYLVTNGNFCDPYSISFSQQAPLPLTLGFQCGCECPPPPPAQPAALHRLAPGESYTLSWDATSLTTCTEIVDCTKRGWEGTAGELVASSAPVKPGVYGVTVGALTSVPADCNGDGTEFTCLPQGGGPGAGGSVPPAIRTACPSDVTAFASFELPASGNLSVPVALSN